MTDDQSTESRGNYQIDRRGVSQGGKRSGELPAQKFRVTGILQNERRLKVAGTVQPARQPEVPLQISACPFEQIENAVRLRRHKRLLYHWELLLRAIKNANHTPLANVFSCLEHF